LDAISVMVWLMGGCINLACTDEKRRNAHDVAIRLCVSLLVNVARTYAPPAK
jgi:hypothetical protein